MRPNHKLDAWVKSDAEGTRYFTAEGAEEEERGKTRDCFVLISSANLCGLCGEWSFRRKKCEY